MRCLTIICSLIDYRERRIMSALQDLANKINTDIDAKLATLNGKITELQTAVDNLQATVTAQAGDAADIAATIPILQAADAKLTG